MTSQPDMQGLDPKALEAAFRQAIGELETAVSNRGAGAPAEPVEAAWARIEDLLASLPQQTAEPVAWRWRWGKMGDIAWHLSLDRPTNFAEDGYEVEPLFALSIPPGAP